MDPIQQGCIAHILLLSTDTIEDTVDSLFLFGHTGKERVGITDHLVEFR